MEVEGGEAHMAPQTVPETYPHDRNRLCVPKCSPYFPISLHTV